MWAGENRIRCTKCKEVFNLKTADLLGHYQRATSLLDADTKGLEGESSALLVQPVH
jgi:hypothetical protein